MPSTDTPAMQVVDALHSHDLQLFDFQLYDAIDPDALDRLVASADPDLRVTFTVKGFAVTVTGDGRIDVDPA